MAKKENLDTSWEDSGKWYDQIVGSQGHYYHQEVIFPSLLRLMQLPNQTGPQVLDLGCGQGVFARQLPKATDYVGVDLSASLIDSARKSTKGKFREFLVRDVSKPMQLEREFTHAVMILSLQNMEAQDQAIQNMANHLKPKGTGYLVLNHPCYRIPRQSGWDTDPQTQLKVRRVNRYLSPLKVPISTHPGRKENSETTWSFHHPLQDYFRFISQSNMVTVTVEEWISNKISTNSGTVARQENFSRSEFPLFLCIVVRKEG